jgi:hypothetical protein
MLDYHSNGKTQSISYLHSSDASAGARRRSPTPDPDPDANTSPKSNSTHPPPNSELPTGPGPFSSAELSLSAAGVGVLDAQPSPRPGLHKASPPRAQAPAHAAASLGDLRPLLAPSARRSQMDVLAQLLTRKAAPAVRSPRALRQRLSTRAVVLLVVNSLSLSLRGLGGRRGGRRD